MQETIIKFGNNYSLVGILNASVANNHITKDICVILLNAGLIHKVGPNNLHVKIARALAINNVASFRFDFSGLGDSEKLGNNNNSEEVKFSEIKMAMDLIHTKSGINKFILFGICTGAEDAFFTALIDDRVVGIIPVDGIYQKREDLIKIEQIASIKCSIRYYKKNMFNLNRWLKIIFGKSNVLSKKNFKIAFYLGKAVLKRFCQKIFSVNNLPQREVANEEFNIDNWLLLFNRGVYLYLLFSEGSEMTDIFNLTISRQLQNSEHNNILKLDIIKDVDHTFTCLWSQELLIKLICNWVNNNFN